nr:MAG TPA: portal [Caudoviricetes sp.]
MKLWEKIKTLVGVKTEPTQTDEAMVTANGRVLSDHPSNRITPSKLKSILEDAENGDITAQHELFMDIEEQDSAIGANIQTRKRAILTLDWRIAEPRNATPAEEKLQTEIDELFYQYPNLENLLMDMMDAVGHGFSALEIEWKLENGKYIPHNFIPRPQSWFKLDKNDNLLLKTPNNPMGETLRPFGWVVHSHKSRSVQLARMGLFRTLAWLYMFKHYSVRDFAEFLELYGMPIRIGKYGAGATNEEKRTLLRALAQIGHNAAGIMPDSMTIELHNAANTGAGSGNNPFLQMVDWCEKSIARLILGQTLTSGADGKSSTNALGNVHNEVRRDLLVSDAKQVAQTITQQIILPYLQINVDPNIALHRVPYFEFDTKKYDDLSTFADAIPKLVGIGVQIPEKWTRDKLGIPEAQDGEVVLKALQSDFNPDLKTPRKSTALSAHVVGCQCAGCLGKGARVALSAANKGETEQDLLDNSLNEALNVIDFNRQLDPVVRQLAVALTACNTYEEASDKLAEIYPDLDNAEHQRYLTQAVFLSELLGVSNAKR